MTDEHLAELWAKGNHCHRSARLSAKAAAPSLGAFIGPANAVVKRSRIARPSPQRPPTRRACASYDHANATASHAHRSPGRAWFVPYSLQPLLSLFESLRVTSLSTWTGMPAGCLWISARMGRHLFSGRPQVPGCPYCVAHAARVRSASPSFARRLLLDKLHDDEGE
jgi:hypothetical protein